MHEVRKETGSDRAEIPSERLDQRIACAQTLERGAAAVYAGLVHQHRSQQAGETAQPVTSHLKKRA